jgi:hypothetical protein
MKRETLQQHEEATLVCEKKKFEVKDVSNMLVPYSKRISTQKP